MIHLNAGNVQQWTRFISSLYKDMEFLLPIFRSNKAKAPASLDAAQVMQLHLSLLGIYWLVNEGIFKALLTPDLIDDFETKYNGYSCKFYIFKIDSKLSWTYFIFSQDTARENEDVVIEEGIQVNFIFIYLSIS